MEYDPPDEGITCEAVVDACIDVLEEICARQGLPQWFSLFIVDEYPDLIAAFQEIDSTQILSERSGHVAPAAVDATALKHFTPQWLNILLNKYQGKSTCSYSRMYALHVTFFLALVYAANGMSSSRKIQQCGLSLHAQGGVVRLVTEPI
jgi:hypothetical protein